MINEWFFLNKAQRRIGWAPKKNKNTVVVHFDLPSYLEIERDYEQAKALQSKGLANESTKLEILLKWHSRNSKYEQD